jgi:hypothetical protein
MKGRDIPQTNRLDRVRLVVQAISNGATNAITVDGLTHIGARHADYGLNSARVLGFVVDDGHQVKLTDAGRALLSTTHASTEERAALRAAIEASETLRALVPTLLDAVAPNLDTIVAAISKHVSQMSDSTARRRGQTLLAWRQQILHGPAQMSIPQTTSPGVQQAPVVQLVVDEGRSPFTMKPRQMKVRELAELKRDGKLFLPDLQRGFVWNNERVRSLHDSLYQGYPIGALLLWRPTWHGEEASFATRPWDLCPPRNDGRGAPEPPAPIRPGAVFVLDGQQRLTSLFRVIFQSRARGKKTKDPDLRVALSSAPGWKTQPFHMYSTQLHRQQKDGLVVPAEVLFAGVRGEGNESLAVQKAIEEWVKPGTDESFKALDRANDIRNALLNAEILAYEIDADVDDDNVIEVFARLNQQGVRLRPSDLAAARLTGSMSSFRVRARDSLSEPEFKGFGGGPEVEEPMRTGGQVDTDLLVRAALYLATGVLSYRDVEKRSRVGAEGPYSKVEASWDPAVAGVKKAVGLLRGAGVPSGSWLAYRYVLLIPAVAAARGKLHDADWWLGWMLAASLWGHYSGSAETVAQADAKAAAEGDYSRLLENIKTNAKRPDSVLPDESDFTQNIVQTRAVHLAQLVHLLRSDGLSFPSGTRFKGTSQPIDIHHIFPRNSWTRKRMASRRTDSGTSRHSFSPITNT